MQAILACGLATMNSEGTSLRGDTPWKVYTTDLITTQGYDDDVLGVDSISFHQNAPWQAEPRNPRWGASELIHFSQGVVY
jgi:hypothetical protein